MTAGFVPPDHWTEVASQLRTSGTVTLNDDGIGTISFSSNHANQRWVVTSVSVSTNQPASASLVPFATIALNTTDITQMSQGNNYGASRSGNGDAFSTALDVGPMDFISVLWYPPPGTEGQVITQVTLPGPSTYPGPALYPGSNSQDASVLAGVIASCVLIGTKYTRRR